MRAFAAMICDARFRFLCIDKKRTQLIKGMITKPLDSQSMKKRVKKRIKPLQHSQSVKTFLRKDFGVTSALAMCEKSCEHCV